MEPLGALAAGVAHDINDQLMLVVNAVAASLERVPPDHPAAAGLKESERAVMRCVGITQRLLAFTKAVAQHTPPVSLEALLREAERRAGAG